MRPILTAALFAILTASSACTPITNSTEQVLENAGSVIRTGSQNLWITDEETQRQKAVKTQTTDEQRY